MALEQRYCFMKHIINKLVELIEENSKSITGTVNSELLVDAAYKVYFGELDIKDVDIETIYSEN